VIILVKSTKAPDSPFFSVCRLSFLLYDVLYKDKTIRKPFSEARVLSDQRMTQHLIGAASSTEITNLTFKCAFVCGVDVSHNFKSL